MSRIMKDCTKGVLYTADGEKWPARVENRNDELTLFLEDFSGYGTQFGARVDFYDDIMGIIQTDCEVKIHRNHDHPEAPEQWVGSCMIRNVVKVTQRHLDVRVDVNIHTTFTSGVLGEIDGTITNLSAGGLTLLTTWKIPENSEIRFRYAFRSMERPYTIRVLHMREQTDQGFVYGCNFIHMTNGAEAAVRNFVFRKMRENAHAAEQKRQEEARRRLAEKQKAELAEQLRKTQENLQDAGGRNSELLQYDENDGSAGRRAPEDGGSGESTGTGGRNQKENRNYRAESVRERQNASTGVSVSGIEKI